MNASFRYPSYLSLFICISLFLPGCAITSFLKEHEQILVKQRIQGKTKVSKQVLTQCYQQKTNRKLLGMPVRLWTYQLGKTYFSPPKIKQQIEQIEVNFAKKIAAAGNQRSVERLSQQRDQKIKAKKELLAKGNALMRWGEPPTLYHPQANKHTTQQLLYYLQQKGYFDAKVTSKVACCKSKVSITYQIEENQPYYISEVQINTADRAIEQLLQKNLQQSYLKVGNKYDQNVLAAERKRISDLCCDHGYFNFNERYISFTVDTTAGDHTAAIEIKIELPINHKAHPVFSIDRVVFVTDIVKQAQSTEEKGTTHDGITFRMLDPSYNPNLLARKIPIRPSQLYSKQRCLETYRRLYPLNMFESINIVNQKLDGEQLVTYIYATPYKKIDISYEVGLEAHHWLLKPIFSPSIQVKHLFKKLDIFRLEGRSSWGGTSASNISSFYKSFELGIKCMLALPQFILPLPEQTHLSLDSLHPMTKVILEGSLSRKPAYRKTRLKKQLSYSWQRNNKIFYELMPLNIEFINSKISNSQAGKNFSNILRNLPKEDYFAQSFVPSFLSSLSFNTIFQKPVTNQALATHDQWRLAVFLESGGTLQNFFDLRKLISRKLQYYQYVKFNIGYSQQVSLQPHTVFAYQLKAGIARPYGHCKMLPWEKAYGIGGNQSIRAWPPKSIGPGAYNARIAQTNKQQAEESGELLLQSNLELRQKLVGFLEGALFVDVGNIWMCHKDHREGSNFSFQRFYRELAIGTGGGLRLNFNQVFILCLDIGIKLHDPARPINQLPLLNVNLGIGYPF